MKIRIRYFASLREALGTNEVNLEVPADINSVFKLREWLCSQSTAHAQALAVNKAVRAALNQQVCTNDAALSDGCEVAFFPPVTGG